MEARARGSMSSSIGNSAELEGNLTLSDRLKVFKGSSFDPDAYVTSKCQRMNEKVFLFSSPFTNQSIAVYVIMIPYTLCDLVALLSS